MTKLTDREKLVQRLEASRDVKIKKWGAESVSLGNKEVKLDVVPSPSWMLDYKLGIGGFPYGHMIEIFGANSLGKTSAMAYPTIANVQKQGRVPALIAVEPTFDIEWAQKLGVDPELMMLERPDDAEEAFEMLHDLVYENLVDYIVLDSLGALAAASEAKEGGKKKAFGISGTVTSGLNAIMPRLFKNKIGLMILNQQRQATGYNPNPSFTFYDSPGGEGLHHTAIIRIQLKPGKLRYNEIIDGEEVIVGRELVCTFLKNKLANNSKAARFDFYYKATEKYGYKLGVDHLEDVLRTAKTAGVIQGGAHLEHPSFPAKLHGMPGLQRYLEENRLAEEVIRNDIMQAMVSEQIAERKKAELKVVGS